MSIKQLKGAALVAALRTAGYEVQHYEAQWTDVGDAENGPQLDGHEAHDVWTRRHGDVVDVYVVQDGAIVDEASYPAYMYDADEEGA